MDKKVIALRGLPSGTPGTSILNSICHCILYVAALWLAQDGAGVSREVDPFKNNSIITYGDDCIYGFSTRNAALLSDFIASLRTLGLFPTSVNKDQNYVLNGPLTFLRRTWQLLDIPNIGQIIVAPLEIGSILRQAVWVKGSKTLPHTDVKHSTQDRQNQLQEAVMELALHGQQVFEQHKETLLIAAQAEGHRVLDDWGLLVEQYYHRWKIGDPSCNTTIGAILGGTLQNPPETRARENQENQAQQSGGITSAEASSGLLTGSYTATPAVAGTAGAPMPASEPLAAMGSGVQTGVPPQLYGLWVSNQKFTWNSQQPVGTLLGSVSLGPNMHPHLAVLSSIYAGWAGSINVRILLSASGVYGGRLLACVLPPGIQAGTVGNPTAYPCAILDARLTAPLELTLPDVRTGTYHPTNAQSETTSLAVFVNAPLINPFSGTNTHLAAVDVSIYASPGLDFTFSILREPVSQTAQISNILGESTNTWFCNRTGTMADYLTCTTVARQSWNHFNCNGETYGWGNCSLPDALVFARTAEVASSNNASATAPIRPLDNGQQVSLVPGIPDYISHSKDFADTSGASWNATFVEPTVAYAFIPAPDSSGPWVSNVFLVALFYGVGNGTSGDGTDIQPVAGVGETGAGLWGYSQSAWQGQTQTAPYNYYAKPFYFVVNNNGSFTAPTLCTLETPTASPTSGNQMVLLSSTHTAATTGGSVANKAVVVNSTQPLTTSLRLMQDSFPISGNNMAIFRLTNDTGSFEVGLRQDGYLMTGPGAGTIDLNTPYAIEFSGYAPISTVLVGPQSINRARGNRRPSWLLY